MTDYSMPVLSEQERLQAIADCEREILLLQKSLERTDAYRLITKSQLHRQEIALAALTSMPMGQVYRGEYDDSGSHTDAKVVCLHDQADWENFADGTLLWLAPPVPVKKEGEQCSKCKGNGWLADEMGMRRCFMCNDLVQEGEQ